MEVEQIVNEIFEPGAKIIHPLHGGMMNKSFVVCSKKKKYVLYIPTEQANEMVDRQLEQYNISLVYKLGITSKNVYFDTDSGIKVNRYIEGDSLNNIKEFNIEKIAVLLKKLHKGSILTDLDYHPFSRLKIFEAERKKLVKKVSPYYDNLRAFIKEHEKFMKDDKLVLSHNDFQKSNLIQDPEDNYWVIDFEFMANNVDMYDIACFGNDKLEEGLELLKKYKNDKPSPDDYKRFCLWRIFISLQWYNVALIKHYRGEGKTHNINFLKVSEHFIENAIQAYTYYTVFEPKKKK